MKSEFRPLRGLRTFVFLTATSCLAGVPAAAAAQDAPGQAAQAQSQSPPPAAPQGDVIRSITVTGSQRLEPDTVRSYIQLRVGDVYTEQAADQALRDLFATELFADVSIRNDQGAVIIEISENPVINRIILEGNRRIDDDDILPEIRLAPRQIFTRTKVRADVARIVELYKRQGRFAATVEPQMVELDQNRVDVVFEINEGPVSKVRQINILGNEEFSDGKLRGEMVTKQSRWYRLFSSSDTYDPDRLAYDQQVLRQFYLTEGYADFRVLSAVAELTPDKRDFIITYVVEEGERYTFGDVEITSQIRDFSGERLSASLPMRTGQPYNARLVEDTVEGLSESAGLFGYAFADVSPQFTRNPEDLTMDITFIIGESERVYIERIDVNGNTLTHDKVVRREFRLNEGDAFNSINVRRSQNRIASLGFFQENFEIEQVPGSAPGRIVLEANVEERATGELQLSAGFSSIENFIIQASVRQRNFRGMGQTIGLSVNYSDYSKSAQASFTEPYLFDRNISIGGDIFRRDLNSFNFVNDDRRTTFEQTSTGFQVRVGVPLTEYISGLVRYGLTLDDISLDEARFFEDLDDDGDLECSPLRAGRFLCDALGKRTSSTLGYALVYDDRDNRLRPTSGQAVTLSQDFAGLGGSVRYLRTRLNASKHFRVFGNFIFTLAAEGGHIMALEDRGDPADGIDDVRLTDRFQLGEPQMRGFDIRGIGPRVIRANLMPELNDAGEIVNVLEDFEANRNRVVDDAIGGRTYYLARAELEIPVGSGIAELGLRPSVFVDAGAVFGVVQPILQTPQAQNVDGDPLFYQLEDDGTFNPANTTTEAVDGMGNPRTPVLLFQELFLGDSPKPRISVGAGVNWNSPFGPFRIDIARALTKVRGDDTKTFTFNVGTQF